MLTLLKFLFLSSTAVLIHALNCWECDNAPSNEACMTRGRMRTCQSNERACQNEVRRGSFGILISKRCKQALACDNNFIQNPRAAWFPSQCNTRTPSSVCRCCCDTNGCNARALGCISRPRANLRFQTCTSPRPPQNGVVECATRSISVMKGRVNLGTECKFTCEEGFTQLGASSSTCGQGKTSKRARFNRPTPLCTPNTCLIEQGGPENGDVTCTNKNEITSVCSFTCHKGYVIRGTPSTTCLATRSWSNKRPACVRKRCRSSHVDPSNGKVTCEDGDNIGSRCGFQCEEGFAMRGFPLSVCIDDPLSPNNGKWSSHSPTCLRIQCQPQTVPFNGEVTCTDGRNEGSVCEYACAPGYYVIGSNSVTCLDDKDDDEFGAWSDPPPQCRPVFCSLQRRLENGRTRCDRFNLVGSQCQFTCDPGYDIVGSTSAVCTQSTERNAIWTAPTPACEAIRCSPVLSPPTNGSVECTNGNMARSTCIFSCLNGFNLQGSQRSVCGLDGLWSDNQPTCFQNKCPSKTNTTTLTTTCDKQNLVGSVCRFTCPVGFEVVGSRQTECEESGEWSNSDPSCQLKICPPFPEANPNSFRFCSNDRQFGSRCDYPCSEGYKALGQEFLTCVENANGEAVWDNGPPTCEEIVCPALGSSHHGDVTCSDSNRPGSVCLVTCEESEGYSLFPPNLTSITCGKDSTWGGRVPCCARECPPYAVMDLVMLLDSSSSIGSRRWEVMKSFVKDFIGSFAISSDASRVAVARYNEEVDTESAILLKDFPDDKEGLLSAFDEIPYNGQGTRTGKAVRYAFHNILRERNGDREDVKDVVVVITDGRAQDGALLSIMADRLRSNGALVYAIGVVPGNRRSLDEEQLLQIAGSPERVLIARSGFDELGEILMQQLSMQICDNRCFNNYDVTE